VTHEVEFDDFHGGGVEVLYVLGCGIHAGCAENVLGVASQRSSSRIKPITPRAVGDYDWLIFGFNFPIVPNRIKANLHQRWRRRHRIRISACAIAHIILLFSSLQMI
jgi:hypothetical protein